MPRISEHLNRLAELAAQALGAPAAFITMPDGDHVTFKGRHGCDAASAPREKSFSHHVMVAGPGAVIVVPDGRADPRFADSPIVVGAPGVRFFAGAAITNAHGEVVAVLCVVDREPRDGLSEAQRQHLRLLAQSASVILDQQSAMLAMSARLETLRLSESASEAGHWHVDLLTGKVSWSDQFYRLHKLEPGAFEPDLTRDTRFFHREDWPRLDAAVQRAIATGESYTERVRIVLDDGDERLVEIRGVCELDERSQAVSLFGVLHDVTEQVAALETARRNEQRYRLLADNIADVIARVKSDGTSNYISPAVLDIIGYSPAEMIGSTAQDYVLDEDRHIFLDALAEVIATGENRQVQYRVVHKDGSPRWVETHLKHTTNSKGGGEAMIAIRHIDDRRALEEQLREALARSQRNEQRYRLVAENMGDVITRVKADGSSRYISSAIEPLLGWRYDEMSGQSLDYVHPEDRGIVLEAIQGAIADGASRTLQHRAVHRDGRVVWLESHFRAMSDERRALGEAVVVMRDITDRKALEADLMAARDRAEAGARAKSEFLANMSHELRTPLTSVIGFAGLLRQSANLGDEDRRHVERIASGSEALLAVINDILDFSKLEAGGVELDPQPFDLPDLVRGAVDLMEAQCAAKGLFLDLDFLPGSADVLIGDAGRLRQVLLNLLSNAVKFTRQGGVALQVSALASGADRARLVMSVADTGVGIAPEAIAQLFERFTQADASTTRKFGGTGLGLAISRQLVTLMGGDIDVQSIPGEGATFRIEIELPVGQTAIASTADAADAPLPPAHILMADDAPANRELVSVLLTGMGLRVTTVENGADAVQAAEAGRFDLILMDVQMPVMDGLQAARAIRARAGPARRTPIIALTANVGTDQVQACLEAGMDGHLAKPINVARLGETLSTWLAARPEIEVEPALTAI